MIDAVDALNVALSKVSELETRLDHVTVQVEKVKHLTVALKQIGDRVVELKEQRDTARDRVEELEGMLEKAQDHLACGQARNAELEASANKWSGRWDEANARIAELEEELRGCRASLDYIGGKP